MKRKIYIMFTALMIIVANVRIYATSDPTNPVTIVYEDKTFQEWDGRSDLKISKAAELTINKSFSTEYSISLKYDGDVVDGLYPNVYIKNNDNFQIEFNGTSSFINVYRMTLTATSLNVSSNNSEKELINIKNYGTVHLNNCNLKNLKGSIGRLEENNSNLYIDNGIYQSNSSVLFENINGEIKIIDGNFKGKNSLILNSSSTSTYIEKGEFISSSNEEDKYMLSGGNFQITGGIFDGGNSLNFIKSSPIGIRNASIKNFNRGIHVVKDSYVQLDDGIIFTNNKSDIYLEKDAYVTLANYEDSLVPANKHVFDSLTSFTLENIEGIAEDNGIKIATIYGQGFKEGLKEKLSYTLEGYEIKEVKEDKNYYYYLYKKKEVPSSQTEKESKEIKEDYNTSSNKKEQMKVITCKDAHGDGWIWSNKSNTCVYKVTNTNAK